MSTQSTQVVDGISYTFTRTGFACIGPVRGWCGHVHTSEAAAEKCCADDARGCRRQGGYSDRRSVEVGPQGA